MDIMVGFFFCWWGGQIRIFGLERESEVLMRLGYLMMFFLFVVFRIRFSSSFWIVGGSCSRFFVYWLLRIQIRVLKVRVILVFQIFRGVSRGVGFQRSRFISFFSQFWVMMKDLVSSFIIRELGGSGIRQVRVFQQRQSRKRFWVLRKAQCRVVGQRIFFYSSGLYRFFRYF